MTGTTTLPDLLREYRVPFVEHGTHHHATHGWLNVDCPDCSPNSGHYRLGLHLQKLYGACWQCGSKSILILTRYGIPAYILKSLRGSHYTRSDRHPISRGVLKVPSGVGPILQIHDRYLRSRGFDPAQIGRLWGVGGIGLAQKLAWRLYIPVHYRGEIVSWTTRSLLPEGLRYISARPDQEVYPLKRLLYGVDLARHAVVVVEGPADVWRIGPGAVATLGTAYSKAQVRQISRFAVRAICFDAELTAQMRAKQLCNELSVLPGRTHLIELDTGKDAGEADEREIKQIRRCFLD